MSRSAPRRGRAWTLACAVGLALSLGCAHEPPSTSRGPFQTVDVLPDLWRFWDAHRSDARAEQGAVFRRDVETQHPALLGPEVFGAPLPDPDVERLLVELPRLEPRLRALSDRLPGEVQREGTRFAERFPSFTWRGPIALSLSFSHFETVWRTVSGRRTLVLGEDAIAFYRGPYANLAPLLDHALAQAVVSDWPGPGPEPVWSVLWHQGFPLAVARTLNPDASERDIGMPPAGNPGEVASLTALARKTRPLLDSTREADRRALLAPVAPEPGFTAGALLGSRVAQRVAAGRSLDETARLNGPPLRKAIEDALKALESPGS